ncbi:hypothetical protein CHS0354_004097 [Potamilus streckersoni]|uniref:Small-subunit processome Utp21 domain-containing protein n=1 Tax=Potamilus streckersoni TaxID=2493646 RepID=A0AAE0VW63_9BIVA|nr:hypothetical protein CHS0354_004097 [Potamilus streckersoni]
MSSPSKIFSGYRALGFVCNHVPLAVRYQHKHKENYVITCVGKAFHTYNCSRLGIVSVSDSHPEEISCLVVDGSFVYTGCGKVVRAFKQNKQVLHTYEGHDCDVHLLLPFGRHLISVDRDSHVIVWDVDTEGVYLEMDFDNESFKVTALMHPSTYLNKILLGSKQGSLQLWNIKSDKLVHLFIGWNEEVTVLEQAPAVDVVAIGLRSGWIVLHNLRYDETITRFQQDWGPVTALSFRTDGHPIMVSGSSAGHIAVWDLEEKKLRCQMRESHHATISGMACLQNEPLMVTSGGDNSLKVWIFDLPDGGGRLLRERSGHSAPPTKVKHYSCNGQNILSAGQDSTLRSFSVIHDKYNKSLGRASFLKSATKRSGLKRDKYKMAPITKFAAEPSRQSDWDNITACHRGLRVVTTWSYGRCTMGEHKLEHDRFKNDEVAYRHTLATAVDITSCGNFTTVGYSSGHVDVYNLQSGIYRGSYGDPSAHSCSVQGVAVDGLNQVTVTAGLNGEIKFWRFKRKDFLESLTLEKLISQILLHRESSMLAVALDNFQILIVDIDTRRVVRTFVGHGSSITDMSFSPDARWLVTSGMDSTVRTWDLPTGSLIDCFLVDAAVTSLSLSPTGDFLVTTHIDDVGVYLWSNMTLYSHIALHSLPEDYSPQIIALPTTSRISNIVNDEAESKKQEEDYFAAEFKSPEQISDELVTLSLMPSSRWQNLLNLDIIKRRNKPKEPPKVPKSAPFFLPTIPGLEPKFAIEEASTGNKTGSHMLSGSLLPLSELGKLLSESEKDCNFSRLLEYLKSLGPSAIDLEIRSLCPEGGGSEVIMAQFLSFIRQTLMTNKNFEIVQAYLGLFLKVHGDMLSSSPKLTEELEKLEKVQSESWRNLQDLMNQSLCLVTYLRSATL